MRELYAIETIKLSKVFENKTAVDSLDLIVKEKELFGLLGVNGAGKTTAIKMLCRMLKPTSGVMLIGGKEIDDLNAKKKINFSPQETAVAQGLTARENLELMAGMYGIDKERRKENVERVIKEFHLEEVRNTRAKILSGGWQRRLSIAMAMVTDPEILFLDEPTLGLDVIARRELWQTLLHLRTKVTVILTTHYLEEAEHLCDSIAIMNEGKIKALGTVKELKVQANTSDFEEAFVRLAGTEAGREIK